MKKALSPPAPSRANHPEIRIPIMKKKFKLHLLLVATALLFTLLYPGWHVLDILRAHAHQPVNIVDLLTLWGEVCLGIGAFSIVIALLAPAFSRFFLGYESKKPEEGDEVYFYVVLTLFIFGLGLLAQQLLSPPPRNLAKDLQYTCSLINDNLDFSSDAMQDKVDAICGTEQEK